MSTLIGKSRPVLYSSSGRLTPWLGVVLVVVLTGGALFGYDQGVISGALAGIKETFSPSLWMVQVITSWVTLGALVGSLVAGELGDLMGRKRTVLLAAVLFTCGAVVQYLAFDTAMLVAGRLIVGAGVGMAAVAAPIYAAELAPAHLRGRFVSGYQLAITIGIFLAYLVNGQLSSKGEWRLMLGAAAVPGLALFVVGLFAPESPRWLMLKKRRADAALELNKVEPDIAVDERLAQIEQSLAKEAHATNWSELFSKQWRRPLFVALGLAVFQQVTGINAIIYYASQIFAAAGFATEAARASVTLWAIGGVNVIATFIAIAFIDRVGRRKLLLAGLLGMGLSLAVVGVAFRFITVGSSASAVVSAPSTSGIVTVCAVVVFITCFAFSLGPVVWTVITEVFPAPLRSRGVALATALNWASAWLVSQFFLSLVTAIGSSLTFGLLALLCVLGWFWIYHVVPETKGMTLEKVQELWNAE